jgi:adenine-specific DNA-methyltransferase
MDEVFGADNFISDIVFAKTSGSTRDYLGGAYDHIIFFAKSRDTLKFRNVYTLKLIGAAGTSGYNRRETLDGHRVPLTDRERAALIGGVGDDARKMRVLTFDNLTSQSMGREKGIGAASWFEVSANGKSYWPTDKSRWKTNESGMRRLHRARRLEGVGNTLRYVRYLDDFPAMPLSDLWDDTTIAGFASDKHYVVETTSKVIERCLLMATDPGDLVLDPTCGSGTTAFVAEQWGRRWITVDTSRVALALARTRLMAARYPYYLLSDSREGLAKERDLTGREPPPYKPENDVRKGFVYRRVPHITLKSIANNPEIDAIYERWQPELDASRELVNKVFSARFEEWEIPRADYVDASKGKLKATKERDAGIAAWWDARRKRQAEMDHAIAQAADQETLYDQPFEDAKRIRVSGPFTVESLSPHRVLPVDDGAGEPEPPRGSEAGALVTTLIETLRKAGVQNTKKNERLKFTRLEPYAGTWLQAEGEYDEADGTTRRVAVCFGPEFGTVGPDLIKEAAKEAVLGLGFDVLVVCGFAFDPHSGEESLRYKKPIVLIAKMNPDLAMGDELLKKTGAGNLFMVFGEPDIGPLDSAGLVKPQADGKIVLEIKGVDVYDPTTGQIRSNSTDDIACWFIDTDYNGESFFVRHAYFTGGDRPFERLQRSLRADIDEAAWASLYSTSSRPFDRPNKGKIAVKVINHYGDEVLKVFSVA